MFIMGTKVGKKKRKREIRKLKKTKKEKMGKEIYSSGEKRRANDSLRREIKVLPLFSR